MATVPPQPSQPTARAVFNNRALNDYLKRQPQIVRGDLAKSERGREVRPPRQLWCRRSGFAGAACRARQHSRQGGRAGLHSRYFAGARTPRLRAQLARALLEAPRKPDNAAGLDILLDLAKDGYPAAMWRIGISYLGGSVIKEDKRAAAFWFRQAADKGFGAAMSDLAYLYERGEGVKKDSAEAARWFERAAAGGHPGGMRNYALALDLGEAVPRNPKQSAEYLLTAFRMGSSDARESLFEKHEFWHADTKARVQEQLKEFGFYSGRIDGEFDTATFAALNALQSANPIATGREK